MRNRYLVEWIEPRLLLSRTIYVDSNPAIMSRDGNTWASAYADLQLALTDAGIGDEIHVADGAYYPTTGTDRTAAFNLVSGVALRGGYAGFGAADPEARDPKLTPSILSGDIGVAGDSSDNSLVIVSASGISQDTVLDGFEVCGTGLQLGFSGAGMKIIGCSPTVMDCGFTDHALCGIAVVDYSSPQLIRCSFRRNHPAIEIFTDSNPIISDCDFSGNTGMPGPNSTPRGIVYCLYRCIPTFTNCRFVGNSSGVAGAIYGYQCSVIITDCIFLGNRATYGGAIALEANLSYYPPSLITNCTFIYNSASVEGGAVARAEKAVFVNCIFWNNTALSKSQIADISSAPTTVSHCDVQGGWSGAGSGNIDADPAFIRIPSAGLDETWGTDDDDYGDLRLQACSPGADAGDNSVVPAGVTLDLARQPRFADIPTTADTGVGTAPIVDMGAYEAVPALSAYAGRIYRVLDGQPLRVCGYGASTSPGTLRYDWDFDNDGAFDDATGTSPSFPVASLPAGSRTNIALRVTDSAGQHADATAILSILPKIIFVDGRSSSNAQNGACWGNAYRSLTKALAESVRGTEIHLAAGTYYPTSTLSRTAAFTLSSGITLMGGYAGLGAADPDRRDTQQFQSILSGDIGTIGASSDNCFYVLIAPSSDATTAVDGVTVTAGSSAGMYLIYSAVSVTNCAFTANVNRGVYSADCSAGFRDCLFKDNGGAGMDFSGKEPLALAGCTFVHNSGSGLFFNIYDLDATFALDSCTFIGNTCRTSGGATSSSMQNAVYTNCRFYGNSAYQYGAIYGGGFRRFVNCEFIGNYASDTYGVASSLDAINCTFVANSAQKSWSVSSSGNILNSILWNNVSADGQVLSPTATANYCDIQQGWGGTGAGNITEVPQFVRDPSPGPDGRWGTDDDDYGDLRLRAGSPCIDAGDNASVPADVSTDLEGNLRIIDAPGVHDPGAIVDMGAYEFLPLAISSGSYQFDAVLPTISFKLNKELKTTSQAVADLILVNADTNQVLDISTLGCTVSYDVNTRSACWSFGRPLPDGNYRATIAAGTLIDTGDGTLSGGCTFDFFALAGDANRDRTVDANDLGIVSLHWASQSGNTFSTGDFNYDGRVDVGDLLILANNWQKKLAAPVVAVAPAAPPVRLAAPGRSPVVIAGPVTAPALPLPPPPPAPMAVVLSPSPAVEIATPLLPELPSPRRAAPARMVGRIAR